MVLKLHTAGQRLTTPDCAVYILCSAPQCLLRIVCTFTLYAVHGAGLAPQTDANCTTSLTVAYLPIVVPRCWRHQLPQPIAPSGPVSSSSSWIPQFFPSTAPNRLQSATFFIFIGEKTLREIHFASRGRCQRSHHTSFPCRLGIKRAVASPTARRCRRCP